MSGTAFQRLVPFVRTADASAGAVFYAHLLGFRKNWEHPPGAPAPWLVSVTRGDIEIYLTGQEEVPAGARLILWVADAAALQREYLEKGVELEAPLRDWGNGVRSFRLRDPDGNTLEFAERPEAAPAAIPAP